MGRVHGMKKKYSVIGPASVVEKHWEYRCQDCGQLRYSPTVERPEKCGACGSTVLAIARPGELPT